MGSNDHPSPSPRETERTCDFSTIEISQNDKSPPGEERQDAEIARLRREYRALSQKIVQTLDKLYDAETDRDLARERVREQQSALDDLATAVKGCGYRQYEDNGYAGTCGEDRYYCEDCRDKLFAALTALLSTRETT